MDRNETDGRAGTAQSSGALVPCQPAARGGVHRRHVGGRPTADFLTQLIVGADPRLRSDRLERTRSAAALYAQAARQSR